MSSEYFLVLRQAGFRQIDEAEVLKALPSTNDRVAHQDILIDMTPFVPNIDGGVWDESETYIAEKAREIRHLADEKHTSRMFYFGLAEIPHAISLGAYLGDEHPIEVFDYHRDTGSWGWPASGASLEIETEGLPKDHVPAAGVSAIRVEISSSIKDDDIEAVIGSECLANVRIRTKAVPKIAERVRSAKDVQVIREAVRNVLASIADKRPSNEAIHLFIAAPVPVCFAVGQELHLRNSVPVQTYRFRQSGDGLKYREAILLTAEDVEAAEVRLTDEQVAAARRIRTELWPRALETVQEYAKSKEGGATSNGLPWYRYLYKHEEFGGADPFPQLPAIWNVVQMKDRVDPDPRPGNEYGNTADTNEWQLSDPLLVNLEEATGDDDELGQLIRLFLFHEYLHKYHSLTKYNVEGVGRFENCLERIDYMADLYALVHQLDFSIEYDSDRVVGREKKFIEDQIDLMLRSTWAFIPGRVVNRWQIRRVRRLLNWYWRHVQVQQASRLDTALQALAKAPTIELVGAQLSAGAGRTFMLMTQLDPRVELSLGLVTEDARLLRIVDQVNYNLKELMEAFRQRDHSAIKVFFLAVFEEAKQRGGALPAVHGVKNGRA